jgi:cytochrome P450
LPSGVVLKKETEVPIPVVAIHNDEKYYPNPEKFDPEKFTKEARAARHPFMPFSHVPRSCIGSRLALLEMKIALIKILREYTFGASIGTPSTIKQNPKGMTTMSQGPSFG